VTWVRTDEGVWLRHQREPLRLMQAMAIDGVRGPLTGTARERLQWIAAREYRAANARSASMVMCYRIIQGNNVCHPQWVQYRKRKAAERMSGIVATMAASRGLKPALFLDSIKRALGKPEISTETLCLYLLTCNKYDLDPMTGEVFLIEKAGKVSVNIGVDGWSKVINREPQYDGCEFEDTYAENGNLVAVTARIYRKDRSRPTEAKEYMDECRGTTGPWNSHPNRMLRHKAFQQAARLAFGLTMPEEVEAAAEGFVTAELEGAVEAIEAVTEPEQVEYTKVAESVVVDDQPSGDVRIPPSDELFPQPSLPE